MHLVLLYILTPQFHFLLLQLGQFSLHRLLTQTTLLFYD
jgi:hypothetical protein